MITAVNLQQFFSSDPDRLCFPLLYALLTTATAGSAWIAPAPDPQQNENRKPNNHPSLEMHMKVIKLDVNAQKYLD